MRGFFAPYKYVFLSVITALQVSFLITTIIILSDKTDRTGWSQTFALISSVVGVVEGLVYIYCITKKIQNKIVDSYSLLACVMISVGFIGLISNTEDEKGPYSHAINHIEQAACTIVFGWGMLVARLGAYLIMKDEDAYELNFDRITG